MNMTARRGGPPMQTKKREQPAFEWRTSSSGCWQGFAFCAPPIHPRCGGDGELLFRLTHHSKESGRSARFGRVRFSALSRPPPSLSSVEVGTPVARRPPHRSRRAVFPHRALQVNSLSHLPSGLSSAAENPAAADRNSVPSGKAFPAYPFPQCAVAALGSAPASS